MGACHVAAGGDRGQPPPPLFETPGAGVVVLGAEAEGLAQSPRLSP